MASKTTAQLKAEKNLNITSNGTNSNTGANHNAFLENLLDSIVNKTTDAALLSLNAYSPTTSYSIGQGTLYDDGNFVDLYIATSATTGAFNPAHWSRVTKRKQVLTTNTDAYVGIDTGTKLYDHDLGTADLGSILIVESTGSVIPNEIVTAISSTQITVDSLAQYANAKIIITG